MDKRLERTLVEKYPNLYQNYGGDIRQTCMGWGFSCGDGWFKLIDELSAKLEAKGIVASQVKEKFGGLRFYIDPCEKDVFDEVHKLIDEAASESLKTCEICGKPGELRTGGWLKTTCDKCQTLLDKGNVAWKEPELFGSVYETLFGTA